MLTLNAAVAPLSTVTPEQRDGFNHIAGGLSQRLMLVDCRKQTVEAIKYEGVGAIQASFEVLGKTAAKELMTDPAVLVGMQEFVKGFDQAKFEELAKEAGVE